MERFGIACVLLGFATIVAAGWAWRAAIRDSQSEIDDVDFEALKKREEDA